MPSQKVEVFISTAVRTLNLRAQVSKDVSSNLIFLERLKLCQTFDRPLSSHMRHKYISTTLHSITSCHSLSYIYNHSFIYIQGVSKRALQLWKLIEIYTEDIHVLNCQNVAKHTVRNCFDLFFRFLLYGTSTVTPTPKPNEHVQIHDTFYAHGTVVPNTATASAPAFEIKMATFTGAERALCVFWFEETKSATHSGVPRNFFRGGFNKLSWGQRTERTGIWGR